MISQNLNKPVTFLGDEESLKRSAVTFARGGHSFIDGGGTSEKGTLYKLGRLSFTYFDVGAFMTVKEIV